ncbi:aspartate-semialdehyde dehydrogenase [Candidatus Desantisbacteria bacterium CG1_02_38_46]|uniref:Aspartate-semialdehyde dehydrogenase n=2 Tax=unclassified Candidatus Desantisiibacteriota TaxID=3106372 RepID=A0A2H9PCA5_9BACT|nr:MAG: aspartate-semialdehyde dehydrogenase [Candidatus Desantisbacteria bacterium CG1_02_38_46]PIZ16824.1 MAG: aspartate-semialdehyde dehydrogenase [Candidatus Desantisbacteria bacterium CG_4_10_14_0_8_um_filter_39_17]
MKKYNVAVVGATGLVGQEMMRTLERRKFPVKNIKLLASERSVGKKLKFKGKDVKVEILNKNSFKGIDYALFSIGAELSKQFSPIAAKSGAVVIDNSNAFRMDREVPLVVPEVNPDAAFKHKGIIANPNCSTIQMVVAIYPLHLEVRIKRIVVSTYQSVSGWGKEAVEQLINETKSIVAAGIALQGSGRVYSAGSGRPWSASSGRVYSTSSRVNSTTTKVLPHQIAFNLFPHIDKFEENGYTKEEIKMVQETRKIMNEQQMRITATCVRVPVFISHSEAVNIETEEKLTADEAKKILSKAPGVVIVDDPANSKYPFPIDATGKDAVYVGRIREDKSIPHGLNLWVVSDNLRKGAALNAVQIAELLIGSRGL